MIDPAHIPENVWKAAMSRYHKIIRRNPEMAWQLAIAAAITSWPGMRTSTHVSFDGAIEKSLILPIPEVKP